MAPTDKLSLNKESLSSFMTLNFLACLLGNFVDQFDLYVFSCVRMTSLKSLGLNPEEVLSKGVTLFNAQLIGMVIGGVIGGIIGDKRGRLTILFGSIIIYSAANLANAFVTNVDQYLACRFLAGLGLAGEVGVCITVALETLPKHLRGYGIMLIMAFGHVATILSSIIANVADWRTCYMVGGFMGIFVLLLRSSSSEPQIFQKIQALHIPRGDFIRLFTHWNSFKRFIKGVLITCPTGFAFSVLVVFAPEFAPELGITETILPEHYFPYNFAAVVVGDIVSGVLGQVFKTRKWVILGYIIGLGALSAFYLSSWNLSKFNFIFLMSCFGFCAGYAVLSYTVSAEQFGTNLRSTVATATPNFARASAILFTLSFAYLKPKWGAIHAAGFLAAITFSIAIISALTLEETYGRDLDYIE